ncbi:MAG: 50S ribosomal protein L17 [Sphingobacteriales bacterium]|nr:MAG: 50S ribosomal protein L17 [Sphingobacteriales bacterium]
MRHGKKVNHLGRTNSHRKAMLSNMATSLILHKRITTTLAKAKALRVYVEPLITKSKNDTTHSRRTVFSYLKDKEATAILFREVAEKVATRPGGYTRIIKLENRLGDNAEVAIIELVDYNTVYGVDTAAAAKKSTRRRGGAGKGAKAGDVAAPAAAATAEVTPADDAVVIEEETPTAEVEETPVAEVAEEAPVAEAEEAPAAEEPKQASPDKEENAEKGE